MIDEDLKKDSIPKEEDQIGLKGLDELIEEIAPTKSKMSNKCIPVLKVGENYIQWAPEINAYRVWGKDRTYIGVVKNKGDTCKNLSEWSDGEYYGVK